MTIDKRIISSDSASCQHKRSAVFKRNYSENDLKHWIMSMRSKYILLEVDSDCDIFGDGLRESDLRDPKQATSQVC